jgi:hypothetical protein
VRNVGEGILDVVLVIEDLSPQVGLDEEVTRGKEPGEGVEVGRERGRQDVESDGTSAPGVEFERGAAATCSQRDAQQITETVDSLVLGGVVDVSSPVASSNDNHRPILQRLETGIPPPRRHEVVVGPVACPVCAGIERPDGHPAVSVVVGRGPCNRV